MSQEGGKSLGINERERNKQIRKTRINLIYTIIVLKIVMRVNY